MTKPRIVFVLFLAATLVFAMISVGVLAPRTALATSTTPDNPVVFMVRGAVSTTGSVEYRIVIDDIYAALSYQSVIITYPVELIINYTGTSVASAWNVNATITTNPKSPNWIIKTGVARSAALLASDLQSVFFTLSTPDMFPSDGSTVSIKAPPSKMTFFRITGTKST